MKVVIIGGVAGGASAAARLRRLDESVEIIMFERGSYISYANCGLPYYVGGEITDKESLTLQTPESFFSRFKIDVRIKSEVIKIDRKEKKVKVLNTESGDEYFESYDKLILSPGSKPIIPNIKGVNSSKIFTLRTIPDSFEIRRFIEDMSPKTALITGGGYIGVEMAENLANAGLSVTIADLADHLIAPLDYDMASDVHKYLKRKGVNLKLKNAVKSFEESQNGIIAEFASGDKSTFDMVLLSVGVTPESSLAVDCGLATGKNSAVLTNEHMQSSDSDIYAVGDVVQIKEFVTGMDSYIPLAGPANKQGRIAAENIFGLKTSYKGTQGSSILKIFDMTVATTGINETAAKKANLNFDKVYLWSASHATYYPGAKNMSIKVLFEKQSAKILGAQIVGFEGVDKRIDVIATAIRAGMTAFDLGELELSYAPPYSSAKDPVNMAGFAIENIVTNKIKQYHWHDIETLSKNKNITMLDVRTKTEYNRGNIEASINIPVDELRERLSELDKTKPLFVNCQSGLRSYIACRMLMQNGFDCYNLAGGYRLYESVMQNKEFSEIPTYPCGIEIIQ